MGEGFFDPRYPRPLAGEGRVRILCPLSVFSKEDTKCTKFEVLFKPLVSFVIFVMR